MAAVHGGHDRRATITDPLAVREQFVEHELGIVARLKQAGVPFLAGTDTPAGVDMSRA